MNYTSMIAMIFFISKPLGNEVENDGHDDKENEDIVRSAAECLLAIGATFA